MPPAVDTPTHDNNNEHENGEGTISTGRARRRTVRAVNYAKEQEFSDIDVFEDSDEAPPPPSSSNKQRPSRTKSSSRSKKDRSSGGTAPTAADVEDAEEICYEEAKPVYTERGYDPNLPPIRERFTFLPEYEPDGSPRIDLIVGRRPVDEKSNKKAQSDSDNDEHDEGQDDAEESDQEEQDDDAEETGRRKRPRRGKAKPKKKKKNNKKKQQNDEDDDEDKKNSAEGPVEYEYLVKYKNRSYLHLEWKTGADLESMNKSAKALYRRYLRKIQSGADDEIEDPNFDPSFAVPQKILDEAQQEITIDLTDDELLKWEKEREKALAEEEALLSEEEEQTDGKEDKDKDKGDDNENGVEKQNNDENHKDADKENTSKENTPKQKEPEDDLDWKDEDIDFSTLTLDKLRMIINSDGPYYPSVEGVDNPYRDGIITEPPKKPRVSYLFFQCAMRSYFQKRNPDANTGELMTIIGDTWKTMTDDEQAPFVELAKEEAAQYEKERFLMEKAQKPNEVWQPMRRCAMVLERISKDGFANIFLEPVDTEEFTDYEEIIDQPMDLGTVRTKLQNRKYQAPEQFARDVRKIWNNCKIYNQHGSAIWHVADYMSKVFERLYNAWVMEFRERYLRWINPKARPWELTCRECDGKCSTPDDQMVMCDHCDALYGFKCLSPPLKKLPKGVWHCVDCKPKIQSVKGMRMLSAVAEQAARKRAELGDTPKKKLRQTMFLVKWAGLGYEFSTWETREDVNDDNLIAEYRRLNNTFPDLPDLPAEVVTKLLDTKKHIHTQNAGGVSCVSELRSQLYAQTRALHFLKFGKNLPNPLCSACGPKTKSCISDPSYFKSTVRVEDNHDTENKNENDHDNNSKNKIKYEHKTSDNDESKASKDEEKDISTLKDESIEDVGHRSSLKDVETDKPTSRDSSIDDIAGSSTSEEPTIFISPQHSQTPSLPQYPAEVVECVSSLVHFVSLRDSWAPLLENENLPPLLTGEYNAVVPITSGGLMMNVGEVDGSVAFLGYRQFPDGSKGPAESNNLIRNVGDKIVAVDGVSTVKKSFKEVIVMLRESGKNKFAYMRFLENKYSVCSSDLSSVGNAGRYIIEELQNKFSSERQRLLVQRKQKLLEQKNEEKEGKGSDESVSKHGSNNESEDGSEGEFEPDSDEDEAMPKEKSSATSASLTIQGAAVNTIISNGVAGPDKSTKIISGSPALISGENGEKQATTNGEMTHSQSAFESQNVRNQETEISSTKVKVQDPVNQIMRQRQETTRSLAYRLLDVDIGNSSDEGGNEDCAYFLDGLDETFTTLQDVEKSFLGGKGIGDQSKSEIRPGEEETVPVKRNDFAQLGDRGKLVAAVALTKQPPCDDDFDNFPFPSSKEIEATKKAEKDAAAAAEENGNPESPEKFMKKSTVKIEQVSTATNEAIHVWPSAETAAATLQLPLNEIKRLIKGDYDEDLGDEVGGFRWRYALAGARVTAGIDVGGGRGKKAKEAFLEFRDKLYDPSEPHAYKNGNRLRDYQVDGVNWLASTYYKRHGCILADEMGLGKTVQIVCYIEHLYRVEKIHRPYLVVVPLSTVEHWRREFEGWTDMVCCIYHDRQRVWRDVLREYEWYYADRPHTPDMLKFDVLVTTYDTLIGDFDVISQIPFRAAVVDEAHRLRNQKGKLLECMREISARGTMQYGFQSRVLMSGTPLQNDLNELWTLLNFIEPFKFPDLQDFQVRFGNMSNRSQVEALQQIISPFMLRRVKEDVAKDIPAKEETVIDVELTSIQKQYYRAIFEHNHAFLSMGSTRQNAPKLMNIQMELRKVCNHPFLLEGVEHREADKQYKEFSESGKFEGKTPEEQHQMLNEHGYIMTSGKMVLLDKLLPKLRQEGHKVLIFSQMVKMLDLISEYCDMRAFQHERLDGRVRGSERQKSIDRFERQENSFIFLLSTRAGGVGINLTAADICIIFDSDWNPQNDVQAQARCHRIGQTKDVRIYRLVTSRTFEQEMFDRASRKLGLEQAVLGTFGQDDEDDKPTNKEMEQLLKKGAYALLEDENDESGNAFCADDIENILAKRTRTRVVEGTKTASWLNKQGMVVSKSKFTSDSAGAALDMDDPLFWQKVMPDFVTPTIMQQKLNDLTEEIIGGPSGKPKKGRGRGRKKNEAETPEVKEETHKDKDNEKDDQKDKDEDKTAEQEDIKGDDEKENDDEDDEAKFQLSRTNKIKVAKFLSDLKSMMEGVFDEAEDDTLPAAEKSTCQKLLLTISLNEKLFNEQQRHVARNMLKRLEGDRRRRCRTSDQNSRFTPGKALHDDEDVAAVIPEELRIVGKKQRKKRERKEKAERKRKSRKADDDERVGDDGYLHHSDSEADWSDVGEDLYQKKKNMISLKEAKRRRQWAADDDAATAAGRPWPVFPRSVVSKVLPTVLKEVMKLDEEKGGLFSEPVPRDEFPEYYEQIAHPMDYGTMKKKLDRGEYRSAQAMQKDFILVMQNCLQFNSPDSAIVKNARKQALKRPEILRNAAMKNNLFIAEDGSVLEIIEEGDTEKKDDKQKGRRKRKGEEIGEADPDETPIPRKNKVKPPKPSKSDDMEEGEIGSETETVTEDDSVGGGEDEENGDSDDEDEENATRNAKTKPRIRIRVGKNGTGKEAESSTKKEKQKKRSSKRNKSVSQDDDDGVKAGKRKKSVSQDEEDGVRPSRRKRGESQDDNGVKSGKRKKSDSQNEAMMAGRRKKSVPQNQENTRAGKRKKSISQNDDGAASAKRKKTNTVNSEDDDLKTTKRKTVVFEVEDEGFTSGERKVAFAQEDEEWDQDEKVVSDENDLSDDEPVIPKRNRRKNESLTPEKSSHRTKSRRNKLPLSKDNPDKRETENSSEQDDGADGSDEPKADGSGDVESDSDEKNEGSIYLDLQLWKKEREALDDSFSAAREHFTKRGPWVLPSEINENKFTLIAKSTLAKMDRHDRYQVFAEAVTDDEAPGYSETVKNAMDFGTMREKVENNEYGSGSEAASRLYDDFLLVFDNCFLYNDDEGEVIEEAARLLALLPEAYVGACSAAAKRRQK